MEEEWVEKSFFLDVLPKMFGTPTKKQETQHQWLNDSGHTPSVATATREIESISIEIHRQGNQHSHTHTQTLTELAAKTHQLIKLF